MKSNPYRLLRSQFTFRNLSPQDTTFYKGLAILMIILHNFLHWLPPKIGENEQNFHPQRFQSFLHTFDNPEWIIQGFFSFFGHYGVQVFLFLSAYGLTKKYLNGTHPYFAYLRHRILKIYPAFLFSMVVWILYLGMIHGGVPYMIKILSSSWESLLYKLSFVANFIPHELYKINGPWWFVSLIVQFYVLFPLMFRLFQRYGAIALILLSLMGLILTATLQPYVQFPLAGTILTHLPELSLGIFFAAKGEVRLPYWLLGATALLFWLGNLYPLFWYGSFVTITLLTMVLFQLIQRTSTPWIRDKVLFVGGISMYIFYINGFMRQPWINSAKHYHLWWSNLLIALLSITIVIAVAYLMEMIAKNLKKSGKK